MATTTETTQGPREWLEKWAARWKANGDEAEANSFMDSGWSKATADRCADNGGRLLNELVSELAKIPTLPKDFFDRPMLPAILEAARQVKGV